MITGEKAALMWLHACPQPVVFSGVCVCERAHACFFVGERTPCVERSPFTNSSSSPACDWLTGSDAAPMRAEQLLLRRLLAEPASSSSLTSHTFTCAHTHTHRHTHTHTLPPSHTESAAAPDKSLKRSRENGTGERFRRRVMAGRGCECEGQRGRIGRLNSGS